MHGLCEVWSLAPGEGFVALLDGVKYGVCTRRTFALAGEYVPHGVSQQAQRVSAWVALGAEPCARGGVSLRFLTVFSMTCVLVGRLLWRGSTYLVGRVNKRNG